MEGFGMIPRTPPQFAQPPVIRSYCLSIDTFDHLKTMQRAYEKLDGAPLTNSQALERILNEHERSRSAG